MTDARRECSYGECQNVEIRQIPFKFSPSFGLVLVTGFWGIKYLRSRQVALLKGNRE